MPEYETLFFWKTVSDDKKTPDKNAAL